jgi:hypothetical protein
MFPLKKRLSSLMLALLLFISASVSANTIAYQGGLVLLSPSDGATGVSVTPTLDWSDMPGAVFYDVQVAEDSTFSNPVVDITGILAITSEYTVSEDVLDSGTTYHWRVRFDDGITTSEWSEVFDFTTVLAPPPVPVLTSPADGSTGVSLTATLDWEDATGADSYDLEVADNASFTDPVISATGITASGYSISSGVLNNNTQYFWRVRSVNAGGSSAFSSEFDFTTIVAAPTAPVLTSPADGSTGVSLTATLDWEDSKGADSYDLEVADNAGFINPVISATGITASGYTISSGTLSNNTQYFWRVRSVNAGGSSSYSGAFSFTTIVAAPGVPVLTSPADGATGQPLALTLEWEDVSGADSYRVQVSTDAGFSTTVIDEAGLTASAHTISSGILSNSTQYFWRVNATNAGGTSAFSSAFDFTTIVGAPSVPALVSPANGATGVPLTPTLDWDDAVNADAYQVQVAIDSTFNMLIVDESGLTSSSYDIPSGLLNNGSTLYWRVRASNKAGTSNFSSAFSFTTIQAAPSVPVLTSPINGATGQPLSLDLDWDDAANAETYQVQVDTDSLFTSPVIDVSDITSSVFTINPGILENLTTYYWRVSAQNKAGNSGYSEPFSFTTIVSEPGVPVLVSPSNGATAQPLTVALDWSDVSTAKGYQLQVSLDTSFATTVIDESNITISQYSVPSGTLINGTWYYWRVKADNAGGNSSFSAPFSFRTIMASPVVPVLTAPVNGATGIQVNPLFVWEAVTGATSYGIQVASDSAFTNVVISGSVDSTSYQDTTNLNENTTYYWRVNATNKGGTSAYSEAFSFTTIAPAPVAPGLLLPENGQNNVSLNPRLDWSDVTADNLESVYELQVALDTGFTNMVTAKTGISVSEYTFEDTLSHTTTHFWRVRVNTEGGTSPWSETWSFTTETITGLNPISGIIPKEFNLHQNYPNPFNPVTKIRFDIPSIHGGGSQSVRVVIYNMLGQTVANLFNGRLNPGVYEMQFNASMLSSGTYFYELNTENYRSIKRMTLVK